MSNPINGEDKTSEGGIFLDWGWFSTDFGRAFLAQVRAAHKPESGEKPESGASPLSPLDKALPGQIGDFELTNLPEDEDAE